MGGFPNKGTPRDKRLKSNKQKQAVKKTPPKGKKVK